MAEEKRTGPTLQESLWLAVYVMNSLVYGTPAPLSLDSVQLNAAAQVLWHQAIKLEMESAERQAHNGSQ